MKRWLGKCSCYESLAGRTKSCDYPPTGPTVLEAIKNKVCFFKKLKSFVPSIQTYFMVLNVVKKGPFLWIFFNSRKEGHKPPPAMYGTPFWLGPRHPTNSTKLHTEERSYPPLLLPAIINYVGMEDDT